MPRGGVFNWGLGDVFHDNTITTWTRLEFSAISGHWTPLFCLSFVDFSRGLHIFLGKKNSNKKPGIKCEVVYESQLFFLICFLNSFELVFSHCHVFSSWNPWGIATSKVPRTPHTWQLPLVYLQQWPSRTVSRPKKGSCFFQGKAVIIHGINVRYIHLYVYNIYVAYIYM